jgi:hypothetical protein
LTRDKKIVDLELELENVKKSYESMVKFKTERDNFVLENTKLDIEIKRVKCDFNKAQDYIGQLSRALHEKEDSLAKLTEEMNYLSFNSKKSQVDKERYLKDALDYQNTFRRLESDLKETHMKNEKLENELNVLKQQMFRK